MEEEESKKLEKEMLIGLDNLIISHAKAVDSRNEWRFKVANILIMSSSTILSIVISINIYNSSLLSIYNKPSWWHCVLILAVILNCIVIIFQGIYLKEMLEVADKVEAAAREQVRYSANVARGKEVLDLSKTRDSIHGNPCKLALFNFSIWAYYGMIAMYGLYFFLNVILG